MSDRQENILILKTIGITWLLTFALLAQFGRFKPYSALKRDSAAFCAERCVCSAEGVPTPETLY